MVEMAYQKTRNFERLSFLYLITGNIEKLGYMYRIATMQSLAQSRFHNALYLGNVKERINVLVDAGQFSLAYITALSHGLNDLAVELEAKLREANINVPTLDLSQASLMLPPTPIR